MTDDTSQEPAKNRKAALIKPPHTIKQKVGSGGLDAKTLERAQGSLDNNTIDFRPIATLLIEELESAIVNTRNGLLKGEAAIEAIIYPAMQIKAQGTMLHYPLATEISDILVNFLEIITDMNPDVIEIAEAHKKTLHLVIMKELKVTTGPVAQQLRQALLDACKRYYKQHNHA